MRSPAVAMIAFAAFLMPIGVVVWQHRDALTGPPPERGTPQGELLYFTSPS